MRLITVQCLVDDEAQDFDLRRFKEVLVEDVTSEDEVAEAWVIEYSDAKVVVAAEGDDQRVYGPYRNKDEAEDSVNRSDTDGVVVALHDPDALEV